MNTVFFHQNNDEPLAQSMLVLMVRGLFNSLEFPYANFHAMRSLEINCMLHFGKLWVTLSYVGSMSCLLCVMVLQLTAIQEETRQQEKEPQESEKGKCEEIEDKEDN